MRRPGIVRRTGLVLAVACLGALALPSQAGAIAFDLEIELMSVSEPLTFRIEVDGPTCNDGTLEVTEVLDTDGEPVEPVSVTLDPTNANAALVVLPSDTVAGVLTISASCDNGDPIGAQGGIEWGNLAVEKVVDGPAPEDATFLVVADCVGIEVTSADSAYGDEAGVADIPDDFVVQLAYPAAGGVGHVYTDHTTTCTLSEPEDGGAASVTIDPEVVDALQAPGSTTATVTNTFVEAIVVEPTFTG